MTVCHDMICQHISANYFTKLSTNSFRYMNGPYTGWSLIARYLNCNLCGIDDMLTNGTSLPVPPTSVFAAKSTCFTKGWTLTKTDWSITTCNSRSMVHHGCNIMQLGSQRQSHRAFMMELPCLEASFSYIWKQPIGWISLA